ncbi:MAG: hypothetical protein J6T51_04675 [Kiritimatiellae bacterium]|nr:hypothetical protein [Kiritimatiellia bacterium]
MGYLAAAFLAVMAGAAFPAFGETPLYSWIGANGNFSDAGNWQNGAVPPAATPIDITITDNDGDIYVTNNITGLTPKSITLVGDGKIHLLGEKMTGLERVESRYITSSDYRDFITAPVEFAGTMTIGGNMWIEFGDAKATTIAFDEAATDYAQRGLRGNVTLTGNWEVDRSLTIGSGTLEVQGTLSNTHSLTVNSDGKLISPSVTYTANSLLQGNAGTAEFGSVTAQGTSGLYFYTDSTSATCSGVVRMGTFLNNATQNVRLNNATIVMGAGGFVYGPDANSDPSAWYNFSVGAGTTANVWPSADYSIGTNGNATTAQGDPKSSTNSRKDFSLGHAGASPYPGSTLNLYTTDYDDGSIARTVTIDGVVYGQQSSCKFNVRGIGVAIVNSFWNSYPGSVTVYDSATLQINPGCKPGTGTVTMSSGTALALPLTDTGAVSSRSFGTLEISGGLALAIDGATLGDGEYTLLSATTLTISDMSKVFVGGTAVAGKVATVVQDGNSLKLTVSSEYTGPDSIWTGAKDANLLDGDNWLGGVPTAENGRPAIIGVVHAATLVADRDFNPVSITFPEGSAKVTIAGTGTIGGIAAITNFSALAHEFKVPVSGGTVDLVNASMSCTFTGGFTAVNPVFANSAEAENARGFSGSWTVTDGSWSAISNMVVSSDGNVYLPNGIGDIKEIAVRSGGTLHASKASYPMGSATYLCRKCDGVVEIDELEAIGTVELTAPFNQTSSGILRVGKFLNNATKFVRLNNMTVVMGAGGFVYGLDANSNPAAWDGFVVGGGDDATIWPSADYSIGLNANASGDAKSSSNARNDFGIGYSQGDSSVLTLHTTDYDDRTTPRTVTVDGVMYSTKRNSVTMMGAVRVYGCGKVVFNSYSTFGKGITVYDTATLAVSAGCRPGSGMVTMNAGTTFEVAESGTVSLGDELKLADGAALGFNFTKRVVPTLDMTGKTVTLGENGTVVVKVSAVDGERPKGGANVLTVGGNFAGANVSLAEGAPKWVNGVSVNADGNIVLDVKPMGLVVIIE